MTNSGLSQTKPGLLGLGAWGGRVFPHWPEWNPPRGLMVDGVFAVVEVVISPSTLEQTDYVSQEAAGQPAARRRCLPSVQSSFCLFGGTDGRRDDDLRSVSQGSRLLWQSTRRLEEVWMGGGLVVSLPESQVTPPKGT